MIKNNIYSILLHYIICTIIYLIFFAIQSGNSIAILLKRMGCFISIEGYIIIYILLSFFAVILYFFAGRFLKDQGSKVMNFMSVSSVWVILLLVWIDNELLFNILQDIHYCILNISFFPLYYIFDNDKYIGLLLTFIPSLFMWLGLQIKSMRINSKIITKEQ